MSEYPRKDLQHNFQYEPGREGECCFFHNWLGGWVKCKLRQNDPIHIGEPSAIMDARNEKRQQKETIQ